MFTTRAGQLDLGVIAEQLRQTGRRRRHARREAAAARDVPCARRGQGPRSTGSSSRRSCGCASASTRLRRNQAELKAALIR